MSFLILLFFFLYIKQDVNIRTMSITQFFFELVKIFGNLDTGQTAVTSHALEKVPSSKQNLTSCFIKSFQH